MTGDHLLAADTAYQVLARIEAAAMDPQSTGGRVHFVANLTRDAYFMPVIPPPNGTCKSG